MSMVLIIVVLFLELPNVKPKIGCLNLNKIWGKVRTNILKAFDSKPISNKML